MWFNNKDAKHKKEIEDLENELRKKKELIAKLEAIKGRKDKIIRLTNKKEYDILV